MKHILKLILLIPLIVMIPALSVPAQSQTQAPAKATPKKAHRDHNPRHGGIFFMALDEKHHLEGTLEPTGTFRLWIYDVITTALTPAQVKGITGTVQWGDANDAPEVPLTVSKDGLSLEAPSDKVKPPIDVTARIRFANAKPGARPELFSFSFKDYSVPPPPKKPGAKPAPAPKMTHDMNNMGGMDGMEGMEGMEHMGH